MFTVNREISFICCVPGTATVGIPLILHDRRPYYALIQTRSLDRRSYFAVKGNPRGRTCREDFQ